MCSQASNLCITDCSVDKRVVQAILRESFSLRQALSAHLDVCRDPRQRARLLVDDDMAAICSLYAVGDGQIEIRTLIFNPWTFIRFVQNGKSFCSVDSDIQSELGDLHITLGAVRNLLLAPSDPLPILLARHAAKQEQPAPSVIESRIQQDKDDSYSSVHTIKDWGEKQIVITTYLTNCPLTAVRLTEDYVLLWLWERRRRLLHSL